MTTTLKPTGLPGSEYGSFEGKPYARPSSHQTSLTPMGVPGTGYGSFTGRVVLTRSIRMQIQLALVARLATISGWNAQLRGLGNEGDAAVKAIVFASEDKGLPTNPVYVATLNTFVEITVAPEHADPVLDLGNPYLYLDRMVVLAERKIHTPDEWEPNPGFTEVLIGGHDTSDPEETNLVQALLRVTFKYRHHFQDPEAVG